MHLCNEYPSLPKRKRKRLTTSMVGAVKGPSAALVTAAATSAGSAAATTFTAAPAAGTEDKLGLVMHLSDMVPVHLF